jgi:hypothetical protein
MTDLVRWVRAQLAQDELIARGTGQPSTSWQNFDMDGELRDDFNAGTVAYTPQAETRAHIARHDPARVLREIDAKRKLLAIHRPYVPEPDQACLGCAGGIMFTACPVIPLLALPYADQPGYAEALASTQ